MLHALLTFVALTSAQAPQGNPNPAATGPKPGPKLGSSIEQICMVAADCISQPMLIMEPVPDWRLECIETPGVCAGLDLTINFNQGTMTNQIDGFLFATQDAGAGATIRLNAPPGIFEVERLECLGERGCQGLTLILGADVDIAEIWVTCAPDACLGCTVQHGLLSVPCESLVVPPEPVVPVV